MSDLIERLRKPSDSEETMNAWDGLRAYLLKGGRGSYARDIFESILSDIDCEREEAADRITALEKENAELKLYAGEKSNQYVAAMEENKALRKALEPFANSDMAPDIYDDDSCVAGSCDFTCGDLRRARKALATIRGTK